MKRLASVPPAGIPTARTEDGPVMVCLGAGEAPWGRRRDRDGAEIYQAIEDYRRGQMGAGNG